MTTKRLPFLYGEETYAIIGAALEVHNQLGHGFLESVYEKALILELRERGFTVHKQAAFDVKYKGVEVGQYVADLIVDGKVIVELKAVRKILPIHEAQSLNYLAATGLRVALVLNFGRRSLEHRRLVR